MLEASGWELAPLPLAPNGTDSTDKDIDGFVEVLEVPLDAPQVVSQLVGGPVDFLPGGRGGVLEELCPSLKQPLGSVDGLLHLSVIKAGGGEESQTACSRNQLAHGLSEHVQSHTTLGSSHHSQKCMKVFTEALHGQISKFKTLK